MPLRVNFDALYDLGGQVVDLVPAHERHDYRYWRGAHLGSLALRLARGIDTLTNVDEPGIHFALDYGYARDWADNMNEVEWMAQLQFEPPDQTALSELSGGPIDAALPMMVFALDRPHNGLALPYSDRGMANSVILRGDHPISMLDPYSLEFIQGTLLG